MDLRKSDGAHIGSLLLCLIPIDSQFKCQVESNDRAPCEASKGLRAVQLQIGGFVRMLTSVPLPTRVVSTQPDKAVRYALDWNFALCRRAEVPTFGERESIFHQTLREQQISQQRVEDVLPGPNGVRIANRQNIPRRKCSYRV